MTTIKENINPKVLVWARNSAGYLTSDISKKMHINEKKIKDWEEGLDNPTNNQLLDLSSILKRPSIIFYLKEVPEDIQPPLEFRKLYTDKKLNSYPDLNIEKRRVLSRREIYLNLIEELGENTKEFQVRFTNNSGKEKDHAEYIRNILCISIDQQKEWNDINKAFNEWTIAVEKLNILVFQTWRYRRSIALDIMRGFCLYYPVYPIIDINASDSPAGKIFSLLHELVHLSLHENDIFDILNSELYCNKVAAEILVPSQSILKDINSFKDLPYEEINYWANKYHVSVEMMIRKLWDLSIISSKNKFKQLLSKAKENIKKPTGFPKDYYKVMRKKYGNLFLQAVFETYYREKITSADLINYLGMKWDYVKKLENLLLIPS
jgi:Zn-dependent peptidase ImmA (M78 family)